MPRCNFRSYENIKDIRDACLQELWEHYQVDHGISGKEAWMVVKSQTELLSKNSTAKRLKGAVSEEARWIGEGVKEFKVELSNRPETSQEEYHAMDTPNPADVAMGSPTSKMGSVEMDQENGSKVVAEPPQQS